MGPDHQKSPSFALICSVTEGFLGPASCHGVSLTHLPTPQVAAGWSLEYEDIIGVEGGGPGCNLKSLGVIGTGSPDLEQPCGGHGLQVIVSGSTSLQA